MTCWPKSFVWVVVNLLSCFMDWKPSRSWSGCGYISSTHSENWTSGMGLFVLTECLFSMSWGYCNLIFKTISCNSWLILLENIYFSWNACLYFLYLTVTYQLKAAILFNAFFRLMLLTCQGSPGCLFCYDHPEQQETGLWAPLCTDQIRNSGITPEHLTKVWRHVRFKPSNFSHKQMESCYCTSVELKTCKESLHRRAH